MVRKCLIVVAILFFSSGIYDVDAKNVSKRNSSLRYSHADATGEIWENSIVLENRNDYCIFANERCYLITEMTDIKSSDGETISHSRFSTPCRVKLVYHHNSDDDSFEAISIEVIDDLALNGSEYRK